MTASTLRTTATTRIPPCDPTLKSVCNGIDDDCDELTDEDVGFEYCADGDADGYGAGDAAASNHYQGSQILDLGNLATASAGQTVGHYWDGTDHFYYLNSTEEGDVSSLSSIDEVGVACFAAQGTPFGAEIEYLWVGGEPIDFDPAAVSYSATASTGSESGF